MVCFFHIIKRGITIENFLWIIFVIVILINSLYFSLKLKFPQLNIKDMIKNLREGTSKETGITSFETLFMSLASKIGVGSLSGISFAIYYAGIGVIFWIIIFSFFISINSYLENYLASLYKVKDGKYYKGGPSYYIKYGMNKKILSNIYSILLIFTYLFGFITIQNNTITKFFYVTYNTNTYIVSLIVALFSCYFIFKGIKSISSLCSSLVPVMCIIYLIIGIVVFTININNVPRFLSDIVTSAFSSTKSLNAGFLTSLILGIKRGVFSSEAGLGSGAILCACSSSKSPKKDGYLGVISTYFINIFITFLTGIIVYFSNYKALNISNINGIEITRYAFNNLLGHFGDVMLLIIVIMFAVSSIITGYYYCENGLKLFTSKKILIFLLKLLTVIVIFLGGILSSSFIWNIIDIFILILSVINIYAIVKLKNKIKE